MANVLMLGNGFDLYHNLLTSYDDFMIICEQLKDYPSNSFHQNVYLELNSLVKKSDSIESSLSIYEDAYQKTKIDETEMLELIQLLKTNCWFEYILTTKQRNGWVSLESQIDCILSRIHKGNTDGLKYISKKIEAYRNKEPFKYFQTYSNDILASDLELSIQYEQFVTILKLYLKIFVNNILSNIHTLDTSCNTFLRNNDFVISFNYTNTYKQLYDPALPDKRLIYIHGKLEQDIVVGINSNENDVVGNNDQRFIKYKKYYQRITKHTLKNLSVLPIVLQRKGEKNHLTVVGHSLDVADGDIITVLFNWFYKITIYYYDDNALDSYVKNLKIIFGATELSKMTFTQKIVFEKLPPNEYIMSLASINTN